MSDLNTINLQDITKVDKEDYFPSDANLYMESNGEFRRIPAEQVLKVQPGDSHAPTIINGTWHVWDYELAQYRDTGEIASMTFPSFFVADDGCLYVVDLSDSIQFSINDDGELEVFTGTTAEEAVTRDTGEETETEQKAGTIPETGGDTA